MRSFISDLRHAARVLIKSPAFTAIAILTLALGIGANAAIFSVIDAVMLRPLPYRDPGRLVAMRLSNLDRDMQRAAVSIPLFDSLREAAQNFESMAASRGEVLVVSGGAEPQQIRGRLVSPNLFSMLGTEAFAGRAFLESDAEDQGPPAAILSHRLWQRYFGGEYSAIGSTITLNAQNFTIVGVLPPTFRDPSDFGSSDATDVWKPIAAQTDRLRNFSAYQVMGRLRAGVVLSQAEAEMNALAQRLSETDAGQSPHLSVQVVPLHEAIAEDVRPRLVLLFGVVGFVLLIACANVANLLLARATNRRGEMAVRAALGASRGRLIRLALSESLVLALLGAAVGIVLATWALQLAAPLIPASVPRADEIGLNVRVLFFAAAVALATSLLFGLMPALRASRVSLTNALREGARQGSAGAGRRRVIHALAVAEIAVAMVLLAGGGLMLKSFWRLSHVDPGFRAGQTLTFRLRLPAGVGTTPPQRTAFYQQLLGEVETIPGVDHAGITAVLPLAGSTLASGFAVEGQALPATTEDAPQTETNWVSAGYFRALGLPLLRGREFTEQDIAEQRNVIIISETLARRHWPNEEAVGKRIRFTPFDQEQPWREIAGVVADVKHQGLASDPAEQTYEPYSTFPPPMAALVVRHSGENGALTAAVKERTRAINSSVPIISIQPMEEIIHSSISQPRFYTALLSLFAALGLSLALIGVYGVLHYTVSGRTHEFGVRMALGANAGDVLELVLRQAVRLVLPGLALGLAASLALTRFIESELFQVSPTDPAVLAGWSAALAAAALVASYLPARRATRVHPVRALRHE